MRALRMCEFDTKLLICVRIIMRLCEFHKNLKCVELECCIVACESLIKTLSVKN